MIAEQAQKDGQGEPRQVPSLE